MSLWENYLEQVILTGKTLMIPCTDKQQQNSIKTIMFRARQKMPSVVSDLLRISSISGDTGLFVKLHIQKQPKAFFLEDGEIIPLPLLSRSEQERLIRVMREDGISEEDIEDYLKEMIKDNSKGSNRGNSK